MSRTAMKCSRCGQVPAGNCIIAVGTSAASTDEQVRAKLIELGWRPPAEPRAAEGAGTYTPVGNGNIDCCECGESYSAHKDGACPAPTAAAAVPAGGYAVQVIGGLKTDADRADALDSLAATLESDLCTMGDRIQAAGWLQTFAYQLRNQPAPRGGVTEAICPCCHGSGEGDFGGGVDTPPVCSVCKGTGSTPPAAQAQDAGPKARHIKQALAEFADIHMSEQVCEEVQKLARALAAKEAK